MLAATTATVAGLLQGRGGEGCMQLHPQLPTCSSPQSPSTLWSDTSRLAPSPRAHTAPGMDHTCSRKMVRGVFRTSSNAHVPDIFGGGGGAVLWRRGEAGLAPEAGDEEQGRARRRAEEALPAAPLLGMGVAYRASERSAMRSGRGPEGAATRVELCPLPSLWCLWHHPREARGEALPEPQLRADVSSQMETGALRLLSSSRRMDDASCMRLLHLSI